VHEVAAVVGGGFVVGVGVAEDGLNVGWFSEDSGRG